MCSASVSVPPSFSAALPFSLPFPVPPWRAFLSELRIDVLLPPTEIEKELSGLYDRLCCVGDSLHGLPFIPLPFDGLVLRYREADGESYCYVEDRVQGCLAGYIIFNRLIEVGRRADRHLRAPHAKFLAAYQGRGIATAIYRWWLNAGNVLITGARQSKGANALWRALGRDYESFYVDLRGKCLRELGVHVSGRTLADLHTRLIMLGRGWDRARLTACAEMSLLPPARD